MPDRLEFTVLTPSGPVVDGVRASKVRIRLVDGFLLSVYPHHAPILGETMAGEVLYVTQGQSKSLDLHGGIFHVTGDRIAIYTTGRLGEAGGPALGAPIQDEADRFDRLTEVLMTELGADPQGVFGPDPTDDPA